MFWITGTSMLPETPPSPWVFTVMLLLIIAEVRMKTLLATRAERTILRFCLNVEADRNPSSSSSSMWSSRTSLYSNVTDFVFLNRALTSRLSRWTKILQQFFEQGILRQDACFA